VNREETRENMMENLDEAVSSFKRGYAVNLRAKKRDATIIKIFPKLIIICVVMTIVLTVWRGNYDFWMIISRLCVIFGLAFAFVGIWASSYMDKGPFPVRMIMGIMVVVLMLAWVHVTGADDVLFLKGLDFIKESGTESVSANFRFADLLFTLFIMLMAPIGILTTISAMLSKYMPGVLLSVEGGDKKGKNTAAKFFKVPDIIDVDRVELIPEKDDHALDITSFVWMTGYTFALGVLICSMLFLNPMMLETVPKELIVRVMIILSIFLPAMVIPWLCIKSSGARVISGAPRPYYLWKGARQQLFMGFATLGLFFFSFLLSIYYGNTVMAIAEYYVEYLIPLAAISIVSGLFYANCFSRSLRDNICYDFYARKIDAKDEEH